MCRCPTSLALPSCCWRLAGTRMHRMTRLQGPSPETPPRPPRLAAPPEREPPTLPPSRPPSADPALDTRPEPVLATPSAVGTSAAGPEACATVLMPVALTRSPRFAALPFHP